MSIVILGAGGRLGRLLRPVFPGPATWLARADVDVLDANLLKRSLDGAKTVICLAGVTNISPQPLELNTTIAACVLDAAYAVGVSQVILFSSAAVYGPSSSPLFENGPTAPASPYGRAKLEMEIMAAQHAHPSTTLRLGNVAGADAILGNWKPGFTLDTLPDGTTPTRSYIGPNSLARVLFDLSAAKDTPKLMNVAAPGSVQMGALLDAADLPWHSRPATAQTIADVTLDTAMLERFSTFDPRDSTPQGIVADWQTAMRAQ